ncbi:hypothetical protein [Natronosalvus vescus]|uniref:hypothetical protein n=1 Tax=Natronosalvus vescus TaxID=2953881 RepID=UPI0020904D43|nr:hypothetical protein [Natronosalvus vescus]
MSKKEQYDAKMKSAWIFGLVDVKITADSTFESKVGGVNRRIDRFTKKCKEEDLRPFIKLWEAPWITDWLTILRSSTGGDVCRS